MLSLVLSHHGEGAGKHSCVGTASWASSLAPSLFLHQLLRFAQDRAQGKARYDKEQVLMAFRLVPMGFFDEPLYQLFLGSLLL